MLIEIPLQFHNQLIQLHTGHKMYFNTRMLSTELERISIESFVTKIKYKRERVRERKMNKPFKTMKYHNSNNTRNIQPQTNTRAQWLNLKKIYNVEKLFHFCQLLLLLFSLPNGAMRLSFQFHPPLSHLMLFHKKNYPEKNKTQTEKQETRSEILISG